MFSFLFFWSIVAESPRNFFTRRTASLGVVFSLVHKDERKTPTTAH